MRTYGRIDKRLKVTPIRGRAKKEYPLRIKVMSEGQTHKFLFLTESHDREKLPYAPDGLQKAHREVEGDLYASVSEDSGQLKVCVYEAQDESKWGQSLYLTKVFINPEEIEMLDYVVEEWSYKGCSAFNPCAHPNDEFIKFVRDGNVEGRKIDKEEGNKIMFGKLPQEYQRGSKEFVGWEYKDAKEDERYGYDKRNEKKDGKET